MRCINTLKHNFSLFKNDNNHSNANTVNFGKKKNFWRYIKNNSTTYILMKDYSHLEIYKKCKS